MVYEDKLQCSSRMILFIYLKMLSRLKTQLICDAKDNEYRLTASSVYCIMGF